MKKLRIFAVLLLTFSMLWTPVLAEGLSGITRIEDQVVPQGEHAVLNQSVTATTNELGQIVFPFNKKAELIQVTATTGTILSMPEKTELGDLSYYTMSFQEKETEVSVVASFRLESQYVGEEADLGETLPNDVIEVGYKFRNTTPVDIAAYQLKMGVPAERELLNIVDFSDKKPFSIETTDGQVFGGFDFAEVKSGKEVKFAMNLFRRNPIHGTVIVVLGLVLSAAFMWKNRDLLQKQAA